MARSGRRGGRIARSLHRLSVFVAVLVPLLTLTAAPARAGEPVVTTLAAGRISPTSVELEGEVTSSLPPSDCHYEYGTTTSYGSSIPCRVLPGTGTTVVAAEITALTPETTYHYRLSVTSEAGTGFGADRTVKTVLRPEYGRCLKVTTGTGLYSGAACTGEGGEKKYEWYPAFEHAQPLVRTHFKLNITAGTVAFLYTHFQPAIRCTGASGGGEYTGNQTIGGVRLTLSGCALYVGEGNICTSSGAAEGQIVTSTLTGSLGILKEETLGEPVKAVVGTDLKPASGESWTSFTCVGKAVTAVDGVIGEVKRNSMTTSNYIRYVATASGTSKVVQKWTAFDGSPQERLFTRWPEVTQWSALNLSLVLTSEEKVEVNPVL